MSSVVLVLLVVLIAPMIYRNAETAQKERVKTALKVVIALWVVVTVFMIARVGFKTHWINVPALLVVFSIPLAVIVGAYVLMTKTMMK